MPRRLLDLSQQALGGRYHEGGVGRVGPVVGQQAEDEGACDVVAVRDGEFQAERVARHEGGDTLEIDVVCEIGHGLQRGRGGVPERVDVVEEVDGGAEDGGGEEASGGCGRVN